MAYANDKFEILIGELKEIIDSMYAKYDNITLPNNGISRSKILRALFKDPDMTKTQASNISKINTARRSLKNQKIENCMKSLLELDDYDETFTDLSVKIDLILTARTQSSSRKKRQGDLPDYKQLAREDNYSRIDKIHSDFSNEISALYNHYDPYPWFNFDNFNLYKNNFDDPSEYEDSIICHKLLYLVLFTGLHINHIQNTKTFYADINLPGFMEFKEADM